jgi:hypothetical protein
MIMPTRPRLAGPTTLDRYVTHAEKFGVEFVYETADEQPLISVELGYLARHLHRVNPRFKLTLDQRHDLASRLVADGATTAEVVDLAHVSYSTVAELRAHAAAGRRLAEPTPQDKQPCGKTSTESRRSAPESSCTDPVEQPALYADPTGAPTA